MNTDYNEVLLKVICRRKDTSVKTKEKGKIYVGIDFAKGCSRIAALDSSAEAVLKPFSIVNSKEGIKKILSKLLSYKTCQIVTGMEISLKLLGEHVLIP